MVSCWNKTRRPASADSTARRQFQVQFQYFTRASVLWYTMEANSRYSVYSKIPKQPRQQIKMHILNQVQVNLLYNTNRKLFLWIEIFICTTDLYNATADRWSCHLPNSNVCATQVLPMGVGRSVPLRSYIKGTELPPANILIPLERQLIALQLCRWQVLYNETLQQTSHPLLSKLSDRRQIWVFDPHFEQVWGGVEPWLMARWKARVRLPIRYT